MTGRAGWSVVATAVAAIAGCQAAVGTNLGPTKPSASPTVSEAAALRSFQPLVTGPGAEDGPSVRARMREPNGVDTDAAGNLYVADAGNHRIRKVDVDGTVSTIAGSEAGYADGPAKNARFRSPFGVAVKRDGTVYVADTKNHRIRAIAPDGTVSTLAGSGEPGFADGAGGQARFDTPFALALDALDSVIVADTGNHRIRRVALKDGVGVVETLAGRGAGYVDGQLGQARFAGPSDVALDERGRIYVADLKNNAIRLLDLGADTVRTLAGTLEPGDAEGAAATARFRAPTGLAVDGRGDLYVVDGQNRAIKKISPGGGVVAIARFDGASEPEAPTDIVVTPAGAIYLTDPAKHAIWLSR